MDDHLDLINAALDSSELFSFKSNVLYYISECIARSFFEKFDYQDCGNIILKRRTEDDHSYCVDTDVPYSAFTSFVSCEKLYFVGKENFRLFK